MPLIAAKLVKRSKIVSFIMKSQKHFNQNGTEKVRRVFGDAENSPAAKKRAFITTSTQNFFSNSFLKTFEKNKKVIYLSYQWPWGTKLPAHRCGRRKQIFGLLIRVKTTRTSLPLEVKMKNIMIRAEKQASQKRQHYESSLKTNNFSTLTFSCSVFFLRVCLNICVCHAVCQK